MSERFDFTTRKPAMIEFIPLSKRQANPWNDHDGDNNLWLLTPDEVRSLPDGEQLESILGHTKTTGQDNIDLDTRFGYTAYGYRESQLPRLPA